MRKLVRQGALDVGCRSICLDPDLARLVVGEPEHYALITCLELLANFFCSSKPDVDIVGKLYCKRVTQICSDLFIYRSQSVFIRDDQFGAL